MPTHALMIVLSAPCFPITSGYHPDSYNQSPACPRLPLAGMLLATHYLHANANHYHSRLHSRLLTWGGGGEPFVGREP